MTLRPVARRVRFERARVPFGALMNKFVQWDAAAGEMRYE
jgi:hypothetical protein